MNNHILGGPLHELTSIFYWLLGCSPRLVSLWFLVSMLKSFQGQFVASVQAVLIVPRLTLR